MIVSQARFILFSVLPLIERERERERIESVVVRTSTDRSEFASPKTNGGGGGLATHCSTTVFIQISTKQAHFFHTERALNSLLPDQSSPGSSPRMTCTCFSHSAKTFPLFFFGICIHQSGLKIKLETHRLSQKHPKLVMDPQSPAQVKPQVVTTSGQQSPSLMQNSSQEQVEACPPQAPSTRQAPCSHSAPRCQSRGAAARIE